MFPNDSFEYIGISSKSGVSDQPMGDEETRQGSSLMSLCYEIGSINRVMDALSKWKKDNTTNPRFVIGLEVGYFIQLHERAALWKRENLLVRLLSSRPCN